MIPIRLSRDAADYVRKETIYLRRRSPEAVRRFSQVIKTAKQTLQRFPEAGNTAHSLMVSGNRGLVVGDYLFEYAFDGERIDLIAIRHGRMQVPTPGLEADDEVGDGGDFGREA